MAFDLNPVAVTAAPLLRAIAAENWNTRTELAEAAGRKPSNIARDIAILVNAALVEERAKGDCGKPIVLTEEGVAQLAGLDRANGSGSAGALTALHSDIGPHPLNPRKDFETAEAEEGLDELRVSIVKKGLLQPIVVRPQPEAGKWWIVAGERRWRAIGQAISDGDWNDDQPIEIAVREVDDREHLLLALNENLQRSNMKAIEEGVAFAAAVHDFGLSTEELSNQTGKSQRYVQQRIALLKLSQPDQDRMRLPKDHPDYLSFKAARAMTQTAREVPVHIGVDLSSGPDLTAEVEVTRAEDGTASFEVVSREPGSSDAAEAAKFGRTLTDREALAFVEIVHKAERHPATDAALAAEGYTEVADARDATRDNLVQKGLIAIRYRGSETPHARAYLMTSGAKAWLEEIGFYQHRDDVLFELRIRVHGVNAAEQHRADGTYATRWLTPAAPSPQQSPEAPQREPEQRALIEETIEERQARQAAERERAAVAQDREFASRLSDEVMRALAEARSGSKPFGDALSGDGSNEGLAALVATAFGALAAGEPELAAAAIAQLMVKGGAMGDRKSVV